MKKFIFFAIVAMVTFQTYGQQYFDTIQANANFGQHDFKMFTKNGRNYVVIDNDTSMILGQPLIVNDKQGAAISIWNDTSYTKQEITLSVFKGKRKTINGFERCVRDQGCIYLDSSGKPIDLNKNAILIVKQKNW